MFKGSKKLQTATGLSEEDLGNIAKGDFSGVTKKISSDVSNKLRTSIDKLKVAKADRDEKRLAAKVKRKAADDAENDVGAAGVRSKDADAALKKLQELSEGKKSSDLEQVASDARDAANAAQAEADASKLARDQIPNTRPSTDSTPEAPRIEPNPDYVDAANEAIDKQQQAEDAGKAAQAAEEAASKQAAAEAATKDATLESFNAAKDLASKTSTAEDALQSASAAEGAAEGGVVALAGEAAKVTQLENRLTRVDEVSEAAAESSEGDPLGLLIAGIGAIAATVIGRKIKTHTQVVTPDTVVQSSYASTLGA